MAFRIIRQRKEARRLAKIEEIFQVHKEIFHHAFKSNSRRKTRTKMES